MYRDSALVEHQDRASALARLHRAKRLVDVLQAAAPRDHLVEHEAALAGVVDVAGHGPLEAIRAHAAALHLLLPQEHVAVELDLLAHRDHADDGRRAAGADAVEALLGRLLETDRLERVVDAAIGQLADGLDGIARRRTDRVGRAPRL